MISVKNIEKSYNDEKVLKGISLTIDDGEFVSIMGESGSGKSTLLSIIGGFLLPDSGEILWNGQNITGFDEKHMAMLRSTEMGFVFQAFRLIPTLNVKDNMLLPASLGKRVTEDTYRYLSSLNEELALSHLLKKYPQELSGGQCQRVAIVRALLYKPSVIILDEPTGALDSVMEDKVMRLLQKINQMYKTTIIQVTHSLKVARYGNRIINLKDGDVCQ